VGAGGGGGVAAGGLGGSGGLLAGKGGDGIVSSGKGGGGGGAGLGGAVYVASGGTLVIDSIGVSGGSVTAGAGGAGAGGGAAGQAGQAQGSGFYLDGVTPTFQGGNSTVSDVVAGTGGITQNGPGTTTLSATNTYTGPTTVNGGTLLVTGSIANSSTTVNSGGTLGGTGTVGPTTVNGTIAPGLPGTIGTLTVNGAYTQNAGSTYQVLVNGAGQSSLIAVHGTATLNGGAVVVNSLGGVQFGVPYHILSATGGSFGTYSSVIDNIPFTSATLLYDDVFLVLQPSTATLGQTFNQHSVASVLGANVPLFVNLIALSPAQQLLALDQLGGELHASNVSVGLETHSLFQRTVAERLRDGWGCWFPRACGDEECPADGDCRTWASPFGMAGSASGDGNGHGFGFDAVGVTAGLDIWASHYLVFGLALGYANWSNDTHTIGGRADVDAFQAAFYGYKAIGDGWLLGSISYEMDHYRTRRPIDFLGATAAGSYSGNQYGTYLEGGYSFNLGGPQLQPIAALGYINFWRNPFTESGAGLADLTVAGNQVDSLRSYLGGRVLWPLMGGECCWRPEVRAFWVHEYLDNTRPISSQLPGGPAFPIEGVALGRDWGLFGLGLNYQWGERVRAGLHYDYYVTPRAQAYGGMGQLQISW
jgi:autotransporter-associated beta strand protein